MENCTKCGQGFVKIARGTGYGINSNNEKICYDCIGKDDYETLANLKIGEKMTLYLVGKTLQNWPGSFKINLGRIQESKHNIARIRRDLWFRFEGNYYWGVQYGDNSELATIKRVKEC